VALTKIVEADISLGNYQQIKVALGFILLACIFDLFDGRVARMGGVESPFGREFDSLADLNLVRGGAGVPWVHRVVLQHVFEGHPRRAGSLPRFTCCAARFAWRGSTACPQCMRPHSKEFLGFPIPSAAGLVASLTLFMIWWDEKDFATGWWR